MPGSPASRGTSCRWRRNSPGSRRAAITEAEGKKVAAILSAEGQKEAQIREAEGRMEASKRDAEAKVILAEATKKAIQDVTDGIGDKQLPALYLLGERYVDSARNLAGSPNAKMVFLPADLIKSIQGILGGR